MPHHKSHSHKGHHRYAGTMMEDPKKMYKQSKKAGKRIAKENKKISKGAWGSRKIESGKKYTRLQKFPTLSPQQQKVLSQFSEKVKPEKFKTPKMYEKGLKFLQKGMQKGPPVSPLESTGQQFLQNLMGKSAEEQAQTFEQPYLRQFYEQTVPNITERFRGMGALRGSGFQNSMGEAGAGLSENLATVKANLINQILNQQMQGANLGLGYSQLPGQRYNQQMQAAQVGMPASLLPQQAQQEMNRYAGNQMYQQRQNILGTQPFGYMGVPPRGKQPGFWGGIGGKAVGALAGAGIGALIPAVGPLAGAGIGMGLAGGGSPAINIQAPQPVAAGGAPQRQIMPAQNNM